VTPRHPTPTDTLRANLSEHVNLAASGEARVVVQRRGRDVCAIVSMADLSTLDGVPLPEPQPKGRRSKLAPFLHLIGTMPDGEVAKMAGVTRQAVSRRRIRMGGR
jgi:prevent-host-death family protein